MGDPDQAKSYFIRRRFYTGALWLIAYFAGALRLIAYFAGALRLKPVATVYYKGLGVALVKKGDYDQAIILEFNL